jgi:(1->4)-alpha-D-glucan 1-alpha-D-glucosylmutase
MPAPLPTRVPLATYRLQLGPDLSFYDAARLVPYLARLGITECYCSPVLRARAGSTHGYDLCDHGELSPDLGGAQGFAALGEAARAHGLGVMVDFVPNHMSADPVCNGWWRSVLENGPSSPFASHFDIDWAPLKDELSGKVLLPILGEQYGVTLHQGGLVLEREGGHFRLRYDGTHLPLNPRQLRILLSHDRDRLTAEAGTDDPDVSEYLSVLFHLEHLPPYTATDPASVAARLREKGVALARLGALTDRSERIRRHLDEQVARFNGHAGQPDSFDALHQLLEAQPYRLASWRTAMHEINYRRFFDVNDLVGIRMEDPAVFEAAHRLIGRLLRSGQITGLRLDHVDGLFDPAEYLRGLFGLVDGEAVPWVVVEKIVSPGERLDPDWLTHGTTGYEFLDLLTRLFVDPSGLDELIELYARHTGRRQSFHEVAYLCKKLIATTSMAAELSVLAYEANRISERHRTYRDFTLASLREALEEIVAAFPVYRTYVRPDGWSGEDQRIVDQAIAAALDRNPALEPTIFHFLRRLLLPSATTDQEAPQVIRFAMKFQQYAGPVQAKGVEDTAFYRYVPLASLNEVGSGPLRGPDPVAAFHAANGERLRDWPLAMLTTTTHDTKRSEDARARLDALSELLPGWRDLLDRLHRITQPARSPKADRAPDPSDEYLLYQTLLSVWPAEQTGLPNRSLVERVESYLIKAIREAKVHSSWINPDQSYETATLAFIDEILAGPTASAFCRAFNPFARQVAWLGMLNSLAQVVLKVGAPGVPDFYQGTELWSLTLVDPDNRGPVDFETRVALLSELEPLLGGELPGLATGVADLVARWPDGRIKMLVTTASLRARRHYPNLFLRGEYLALEAIGRRAGHLVAFGRRSDAAAALVIAPRLLGGLLRVERSLPTSRELWRDTVVPLPPTLAKGHYRNAITGELLEPTSDGAVVVAEALASAPVGLFITTDN